MSTLNQSIKTLNDYANAHEQINSFGSGEISDFATSGTTVYPSMWVDFEPCTVDVGSFKQVVRVYLCDRVQKGALNLNEVLSDMQSVALDTIAYMSNPTFSWVLINSGITLNPFFESKFDDEVAGYYFDLTLKEKFDLNRCQIPLSSTPSNSSAQLVVTILDQDGNIVTTVNAGLSYTVTLISGIDGGGPGTVYTNSIVSL